MTRYVNPQVGYVAGDLHRHFCGCSDDQCLAELEMDIQDACEDAAARGKRAAQNEGE